MGTQLSFSSTVGNTVIEAIKFCFENGYMSSSLTSTILTLVPKVENATKMNYGPIACCNVVYKCYSTILTNRLKRIIPYLISEHQNAFVQGRSIIDNVLLMHEVVRNYHSVGGKPRAILKVDIMKTHDKLD
ncbi:hypothetical protein ACH5RR_035399 [Cinchona calisaya]|uniref:Reverse transcriptase domain-containing protein n=1 Tax=Cinchona calisaya TaxID=153742 RepID=A0ABD2Y559_9GENT